jgi:hypothetical protein
MDATDKPWHDAKKWNPPLRTQVRADVVQISRYRAIPGTLPWIRRPDPWTKSRESNDVYRDVIKLRYAKAYSPLP